MLKIQLQKINLLSNKYRIELEKEKLIFHPKKLKISYNI